MNPEIKSKWVAALRSGEYKQCTGQLRHDDGHCCLGVLCDLHSKETGGEWHRSEVCWLFSYDFEHLTLPQSVIEWAGVPATAFGNVKLSEDQFLSDLNDGTSGHSKHAFDEIADLIEKHL